MKLNNSDRASSFRRAALVVNGRSTPETKFLYPLNHIKKLLPLNFRPPIKPNSNAYILKINQGKIVRKSTFISSVARLE